MFFTIKNEFNLQGEIKISVSSRICNEKKKQKEERKKIRLKFFTNRMKRMKKI